MNIKKAITQLSYQASAIIALASDLTEEQARWKPDAENWSVLEVLNHLVDEEILDFRAHLDHILHSPDLPWPSINPGAWVTEKAYNQRSLAASIQNFRRERDQSLTWLSELKDPNWESFPSLPWGNLTAGDMLASWLAHDLLHIRQLVELRYALTALDCAPHQVSYAGEW
jgi:hypothetical protein